MQYDVSKLTQGRSQFHPDIPGLQIAWDSTSLGLLKECPRKYFYTMVLGVVGRREALPLTFGIYYHAALEHYQVCRAKGADHEEAYRAAVVKALQLSWRRTSKHKCKACNFTLLIDVEKNFDKPSNKPPRYPDQCPGCHAPTAEAGVDVTYHTGPWLTDDTKRNRTTLVRSIAWYLDQYKDDPCKTVILTNGRPAVELSFKFPVEYKIPQSDANYILCGHIDRLVDFLDLIYVTDHKTTTSSLGPELFGRYSPDNQMSLYTLASKVVFNTPAAGVIIDACQIAVGFSRYARGYATRTPSQIEEWYSELGFWLESAERFAQAQFWPMNDKACGNYGGCTFRDICSKDPKVRPEFLRADFIAKDWNPLIERGED